MAKQRQFSTHCRHSPVLQIVNSGCHSQHCYRLSSSAHTRWPHAALPGTHLWWHWYVHSAMPMYLQQVHIPMLSPICCLFLLFSIQRFNIISIPRVIFFPICFVVWYLQILPTTANWKNSHSPFGLNSSVTALIGQPPLAQPCRLRRAWLELMWVKTGWSLLNWGSVK